MTSLALIVNIEASLFERESRSSNHTGFITEAGWKKAEVFFESGAELGAQVFFKRLKQKVTSFRNAAADDNSVGIQQPAAVH